MHEISVMQSALEVALDHADRRAASRIHRIALRVGPLSGVVPEALEFAFDVVTRDTIAEGAEFVIEHVPILCDCEPCGLTFSPEDLCFDCPRCHRPCPDVRQGKELEVAYLEVS